MPFSSDFSSRDGSAPNRALGESATSISLLPSRTRTRRDSSETALVTLDDGAFSIGRKRQGLARFDCRTAVRDPAIPPDQAAGLVVATPHEAAGRSDPVRAAAADERGEHSVVVPLREAHPGEITARTYEHAALTVGEQRVLAQDVWSQGFKSKLSFCRRSSAFRSSLQFSSSSRATSSRFSSSRSSSSSP